MAKKNKNDHRIEYSLSSFYREKLTFKNNTLYFGSNARVNEVANAVGISVDKALKDSGLGKGQNPYHILDDEQIAELAINNGFEFEKVDDVSEVNVVSKINTLLDIYDWPEEVKINKRPPVVTIMGHVDHGKTTLLDTIRKSRLTTKEVGGITQKIGAYQIENKGNKLTFIDTPGHEAFTEMRANGSKVTDIVIIVIAADDSIMPQTRESIDHAKAAGVPIIVAVNKMDSPGADLEKVKTDLTQLEVIPEDWGGDVPFMPISALKGEGIEELIETVMLTSEMLELKAPENVLGAGSVIESNVYKQRGNLVSVIVQYGTLKIGDLVIVDDFTGTVKAMHDDQGKQVQVATPGTPVEIYGIGNAPLVGSKFVVSKDKNAQKIADATHEARLNQLRSINNKLSAADLFAQLSNNKKAFNVIIKTDSLGVLEAISAKVVNLQTDDVEVKIVRKDVGEITTTDVILAEASNASIYTFNIKTSQQVQALIKNKQVPINEFNIIYKLFEDIENKINGLIEDKFEEKYIGKAEVLKLFSFSKIGTIAGSRVTDGVIRRNSLIDVERDGKIIFTSEINSLRVEKDQIKEVATGRECGIVIKNLDINLQEGDIFIAKELIKIGE